jgi:hypothetical protein
MVLARCRDPEVEPACWSGLCQPFCLS